MSCNYHLAHVLVRNQYQKRPFRIIPTTTTTTPPPPIYESRLVTTFQINVSYHDISIGSPTSNRNYSLSIFKRKDMPILLNKFSLFTLKMETIGQLISVLVAKRFVHQKSTSLIALLTLGFASSTSIYLSLVNVRTKHIQYVERTLSFHKLCFSFYFVMNY